MELYIQLQLKTVLAGFALGAAAALVYDLLRTVRIYRRGKIITHLSDAVYVLLTAWALLRFALAIGQGELRLYVLPCVILGGVGYFHFLSPLLRPLWKFWGSAAAQFLRWLFIPFALLWKYLKKVLNFTEKIIYFFKNFSKMKMYPFIQRFFRDKGAKNQ